MKKILIFVNSFNTGGITSLITDIYRTLDRSKYSIDFIRPKWALNEFDKEVLSKGDMVYYIDNEKLHRIPVLNYYFKRQNMIKKVCKAIGETKYDIAYIHANAVYAVPAAKKMGISNIIMHSHEALSDFKGNENKSKLTAFVWNNRKKMYNKLVKYKVGDSVKACTVKFGESIINDKHMVIIHPPINMKRFNPKRYDKKEFIEQYNINESKFNMIHVGRLSEVKNQGFMIDIVNELSKKMPCHLYIVGDGDDERTALINRAKDLDVVDYVTFLPGNTSPGIYTTMNCSLLPSHSEAFGMVAVESQLMGIPCFASTNVPNDVDIGMCSFLPLEKGAKYWANSIKNYNYNNAEIDDNKAKCFTIEKILSELYDLFEERI